VLKGERRLKRARMCSMARLPSVEKGTQFAEALWNDTSGIILPYVTVMLVAIVGLSVLAAATARHADWRGQ